jgi:hypothetical protein
LARVFVLPLYIVCLWSLVWYFRRRWIAFAMLCVGLLPIGLFSAACIQWLRLNPAEAPPTWLYWLATIYGVLFLLGGLVIACAHRTAAAQHPCHQCGYELLGLSAPTLCPECGSAIRVPLPHVPAQPAPVVVISKRDANAAATTRAKRFVCSRHTTDEHAPPR